MDWTNGVLHLGYRLKVLVAGGIISMLVLNLPSDVASLNPVYVPGIGEINTGSSNGLKIIVVVHTPSSPGNIKVQVTTTNGNYLYYNYNPFGQNSFTTKFLFYPGLIPTGSQFTACATQSSKQVSRCTTGTNGPETEPEFLYITLPGGRTASGGSESGSINWENLCVKYHYLIGVTELRCHALAHGTTITSEGNGFLICSLITKAGPAVLGLPDILSLVPC